MVIITMSVEFFIERDYLRNVHLGEYFAFRDIQEVN